MGIKNSKHIDKVNGNDLLFKHEYANYIILYVQIRQYMYNN